MNNTIVQQGRFTSDGETKELQIRSDIDWMRVLNYTIADADQTTAIGVEYYWQRGMASDTGISYLKSDAANADNLTNAMASGGFTLQDTSGSPLGPLNATMTAISTASPPVVTNTGVNALVAGDVVRLTNPVGAQQLGGLDFTVGNGTLSDTTFSLDYMQTLAAAATTGSWRKIKFDPQFYPAHRSISEMSKASEAVVRFTVTHGYTVGQKIRLVVPAAYGMVEANDKIVEVTAVSLGANEITTDLDTSSFTTFAFPATADVPFTQALGVPVGQATSSELLGDATTNVSYIGMTLAAGTSSPAGAASDVVYWTAGKSFSVDNS